MHSKINLDKLLNITLVNLTNKTKKEGVDDYPIVDCNCIPDIDYLATYSQPSTYFQTHKTCLSFFEYDKYFDGKHGLFNAIYYNDELRLE